MTTHIETMQTVHIPAAMMKNARLDGAEIAFELTADGLLLKPSSKSDTKSRKRMETSITQSLIGAIGSADISLDEIRNERLEKYANTH